ncbi:MAG: LapA family protein [Acidobacteriota bacterium]
MRVIKVLFLLAFFFVCMLFFVQNTAILETPLLLKLGAFGYQVQSPGVPFYVVLLLSFVAGGLFCTLYFLAEKVRLAAGMRSLQNKVNALEKQMAQQKKSTVATPPSYVAVAPTSTVMPAAAAESDKKAEA